MRPANVTTDETKTGGSPNIIIQPRHSSVANNHHHLKAPTTAGLSSLGKKRKQSHSISMISGDSSEVEEEKLPPFLGSVENHLHKEYNQF